MRKHSRLATATQPINLADARSPSSQASLTTVQGDVEGHAKSSLSYEPYVSSETILSFDFNIVDIRGH